MSETTHIEWCDATVNFWWGCTKVSPACANCYAETLSNRFRKEIWGKGKPREDHRKGAMRLAFKLDRQAGDIIDLSHPAGDPPRPRVFANSMSDWLDEEVPIEWLADMLDTIRRTPNLDWLLLTKRPENFRPRLQRILDHMGKHLTLEEAYLRTFIELMLSGRETSTYTAPEVGVENYWIGTTVEDQARADERIPLLLQIPAKVRFLSCEPLLEPVDLQLEADPPRNTGQTRCRVDWVITGGESGNKCRHFSADWARDLRDQCHANGVPFFMKQMGGTRKPFPAIPADLMIREFPR